MASLFTSKRIALVRQKYNPSGGAERFVSRALTALRGAGVDVTLVTRRWDDDGGHATLKVDPFYVGRLWRDWSFARGVTRALAARSFDLVQSHERIPGCDVYRAGDGVHAEWLRQRSRVMTPLKRLGVALNPYHRYLLATERRVFEHPALRAVICISRMVKDEVIAHYGIPAHKLRVHYLGVDTELFHPRFRQEYRAPVRARLGVPEEALMFLYVGNGFERKGVATAIRAVREVRLPCHLVVAGSDKASRHYQALAQRLGVSARVHFVGAQRDIREFYAAADAQIHPALYEPFGHVNMEALAMCLPVLTSQKCGAAELIAPAGAGYVHDALDHEAFARSMERLADPVLRTSMGDAGRAVAERHDLAAMTAGLLALYRELLEL